jgi:RHS repeat-associated protein
VGKAAAERRWVGASPTQTNDGDVAAISVFTRPTQRLKAEYGKGGRLLKKREWTFEYDARGRRIAKVRTLAGVEERTTYEWDGRDKLRAVRKPDGTTLDYSYDVFGRRVSKTRSGGPLDEKRVEFLWDGEVLAWELDSEKGPRTFVHEPGSFEPILQQQGGETYLCVNDHLGMPKELIDGEGNLAWAAAHGAYGAVIATEGPGEVEVDGGFVSGGPRVESPFRLLGQVHDEDAELSWTRFRCFDADTGTWISTDPLEMMGGFNLYAVDGSPTSVSDPLGLSTVGSPHSSGLGTVTGDYDAMNPGPLPDDLAGTFAGGRYQEVVLSAHTVLHRAGEANKPLGQFFDTTPAQGVLQARIDKAVLPRWPGGGTSPIDTTHAVQVPAGTKVYVGPVSSQGGSFVGGTQQVVVPKPWTIPGVKPVGSAPLV